MNEWMLRIDIFNNHSTNKIVVHKLMFQIIFWKFLKKILKNCKCTMVNIYIVRIMNNGFYKNTVILLIFNSHCFSLVWVLGKLRRNCALAEA